MEYVNSKETSNDAWVLKYTYENKCNLNRSDRDKIVAIDVWSGIGGINILINIY